MCTALRPSSLSIQPLCQLNSAKPRIAKTTPTASSIFILCPIVRRAHSTRQRVKRDYPHVFATQPMGTGSTCPSFAKLSFHRTSVSSHEVQDKQNNAGNK